MEFNSMSEANEQSHHRVRAIVSLVASILVALTLLLSGSGKVFGYGDMPGQTMQFIGAILPDAWLTPQLAFFISQILFPYILPWAELCLGLLLLLRIWPRFWATLTLPLTAAFIANNAWYISQGDLKFTPCECFGIWEKFIGTFTHVESLYIDIVLFALALTVVLIHPADFFSSPPWLAKLQKRNKGQSK
jgi:uncharacterized membrane protein YphA (DoxX/SURF4 family)